MSNKTNVKMREIHRYLGFFLAGIMAVYALSGIILIFRETSFLKTEQKIDKKLPLDIKKEQLGRALRLREFRIDKEENGVLFFEQGTFDTKTGKAHYTKSELPKILEKLTQIHKASTKQPLYFLNLFFGLALLFFVISSFWMFMPSSSIFKKGMYFAVAGIVLTLILIFI